MGHVGYLGGPPTEKLSSLWGGAPWVLPWMGGWQSEKPTADNIVDKTTHYIGIPTGPPRQAGTNNSKG